MTRGLHTFHGRRFLKDLFTLCKSLHFSVMLTIVDFLQMRHGLYIHLSGWRLYKCFYFVYDTKWSRRSQVQVIVMRYTMTIPDCIVLPLLHPQFPRYLLNILLCPAKPFEHSRPDIRLFLISNEKEGSNRLSSFRGLIYRGFIVNGNDRVYDTEVSTVHESWSVHFIEWTVNLVQTLPIIDVIFARLREINFYFCSQRLSNQTSTSVPKILQLNRFQYID